MEKEGRRHQRLAAARPHLRPPLPSAPGPAQADLLAMRRNLGGLVQYFERDRSAVVDYLPVGAGAEAQGEEACAGPG